MTPQERRHLFSLYNAYLAEPSLRNFRALRDYAWLDYFSVATPVQVTSLAFVKALGRHFSAFSARSSARGLKFQLAQHLDKKVTKYLNALRSSSKDGLPTTFIC